MSKIVHSAQDMIGGMTPTLSEGAFVFASTQDAACIARLIPYAKGTFVEAESTSLLLPVDVALGAGFDVSAPMHCITLNVYSALDGVGLTAAVAGALADHDIPCNMVAAFHHDHVFVPVGVSTDAMDVLRKLQEDHSATS